MQLLVYIRRSRLHPALISALLFAASSWPAYAVEGVIQINQAGALAGGITPGDTPGFPVTIAAPGSYVLTSNLSVSGVNTDGLFISADDVSIDLNGFEVRGPIACTGEGTALSCDAGSSTGILGMSRERIRVFSGRVLGFGNAGVSLGHRSLVRDVTASSNGGLACGISVQSGSVVRDSVAHRNGGCGIGVSEGTVAQGNSASSNRGSGIEGSGRAGGAGTSIVGNVVFDNGIAGITAGPGSVVRNNSAYRNEDDGITVGFGCLVTDNASYDNGTPTTLGSGIRGSANGTFQRNAVSFNERFGLELGASDSYGHNLINANTGGTVQNGINVGGNVCNSSITCP